jgi:transposase
VIAPHLPRQVPGDRGRPRVWPARRIVEAILYLDRTGCARRYLPADFPPWRTVYGWDNAKKANGRKRPIAVDAMGLLLAVVITAASAQDRDAARPLLWNLRQPGTAGIDYWADAPVPATAASRPP